MERQLELGGIYDDEEKSQSYLGVPIFLGDAVLGVASVQSYQPDAFDDADVRLLSTLAASMGVALENARLFNETQRLLKETEQRTAELAIINSVQDGLASNLDIQAIYDLVGDKIAEHLRQRGSGHPYLRPEDRSASLSIHVRGRQAASDTCRTPRRESIHRARPAQPGAAADQRGDDGEDGRNSAAVSLQERLPRSPAFTYR